MKLIEWTARDDNIACLVAIEQERAQTTSRMMSTLGTRYSQQLRARYDEKIGEIRQEKLTDSVERTSRARRQAAVNINKSLMTRLRAYCHTVETQSNTYVRNQNKSSNQMRQRARSLIGIQRERTTQLLKRAQQNADGVEVHTIYSFIHSRANNTKIINDALGVNASTGEAVNESGGREYFFGIS